MFNPLLILLFREYKQDTADKIGNADLDHKFCFWKTKCLHGYYRDFYHHNFVQQEL